MMLGPKQELQRGLHVFSTTMRFIKPQLATDFGWTEVELNFTNAVELI